MPNTSDPNIPLQAGQNIPNFGFMNPQQRINMQVLALHLQEAQQAQSGHNMLRALYGDPTNLDPTTRQLTPDATAKLYATDPQLGMQYSANAAKVQEQTLRTQGLQSDLVGKWHRTLIDEVSKPSVQAYDDKIAAGWSPPQAQQYVQTHIYKPGLDDFKSGSGADPQFLNGLHPNFDPVRTRGVVLSDIQTARLKIDQDRLARDATGKPQNVSVPGPDGNPTSTVATFNRDTKQWTGQDGNRVNPLQILGDKGTTTGKIEKGVNYSAPGPNGQQITGVATFNPNTGQYTDTATGQVVKPTSLRSPEAGQTGRAGQITQRMLNSAGEAIADVANIADLPITTNKGIMAGVKPGTGLLDAPRAAIANTITSQDAQIYNAATTGLARGLTTLDSGGVYINAHLTDQLDRLQLAPGDTVATKLVKMAETRQIAEASLQSLLTSPILTDQQRKYIGHQLDTLRQSIPFTVADVSAFVYGSDPKDTIRKVAKQRLSVRAPKQSLQALPATTTIGGYSNVYPNVTPGMFNTLEKGDLYSKPGSSTVYRK